MINIQNAVKVPYNEGANFITVYFDFEDENVMYAVPVPRIATDPTGNPAISFTKYINNDVDSFGYLNMDVEVELPIAARKAAEEKYPDKTWGQFQWIATECYLSFDLPSSPDGKIIQGQPSLYGTNRTNFTLNIESNEDLNAIEGAFKGHPLSSFQIEYDMTTLTKLSAVKAKVTFDAKIAVDFEYSYEYSTNVWGQSKIVSAEIKKNLKISKAGDVIIDWGVVDPSDEFKARVNDWAWTTLEKAVSDAVATAQAAAQDAIPVDSMDSFEQNYLENSVVEWAILSSAPLSGFTFEQWDDKIYHEIDNRQLVINFGLKGDLLNSQNLPVCEQVKITVDYPTKTTGNTFVLSPVDNGNTMNTYTAPGYIDPATEGYDPNYRYKYEVLYSAGDTFESGWIPTSDTQIDIIPAELGTKKVEFNGNNIPFGDEDSDVKQATIDFFFLRPKGEMNKTQTKILTSEVTCVTFESQFAVAITNLYTFRVLYTFNDGTQRIMNTVASFGSMNSDLVVINTNAAVLVDQTFSLQARKVKIDPDGSNKVDYVYLDVNYIDDQNSIEKSHTFDWEVQWPTEGGSPRQRKLWNFSAFENPTGAYFKCNGDYDDSNGAYVKIKDAFIQANSKNFQIEPGFGYYGIKIEPDNIDWNVVAKVTVNLEQQLDGEKVSNLARIPIIDPSTSIANMPSYYTAKKAIEADNLEFKYMVEYIQKDGSATRDSAEITVTDKLNIILPENGVVDLKPSMHEFSIAMKTPPRKSKARSSNQK